MKLRRIVYGMLCMGALASCSDQMNYHEYNNYDEDFVKLNFSNVGGLITTITWIWILILVIILEQY